jgi:hypothetical protein
MFPSVPLSMIQSLKVRMLRGIDASSAMSLTDGFLSNIISSADLINLNIEILNGNNLILCDGKPIITVWNTLENPDFVRHWNVIREFVRDVPKAQNPQKERSSDIDGNWYYVGRRIAQGSSDIDYYATKKNLSEVDKNEWYCRCEDVGDILGKELGKVWKNKFIIMAQVFFPAAMDTVLQHSKKGRGIVLDCMNLAISENLWNLAHRDADEGETFTFWIDERRKNCSISPEEEKISHSYLHFPTYGFCIQLNEGLAIAFRGSKDWHHTIRPEVINNCDKLYGVACFLSGKLSNK